MKLASKHLRWQDELLRGFGYEFEGFDSKGHPAYYRDGFARLAPSSTPRNEYAARRSLLGELRRRHPEHAYWETVKRKARRRSRKPNNVAVRPRALKVAPDAPEPVAVMFPLVRPERTSCIDCGRPWLSDLDYTTRGCPECGGEIIPGREQAA